MPRLPLRPSAAPPPLPRRHGGGAEAAWAARVEGGAPGRAQLRHRRRCSTSGDATRTRWYASVPARRMPFNLRGVSMIIPLLNIAITARRRLLLLLRDDAVPHSGETAAPRRHGLGSPTMTGRRAPARGHAVDQPAAPSHPPAFLLGAKMPCKVGVAAVRLGVGLCGFGTITPHECCSGTHCAPPPRARLL